MTTRELADVIRGFRFTFANEDRLQEGIAGALADAGIDAEREVRIDARRRIDLLADRIGVEVKVDGSSANVARQVARYLESDLLDGLVLVTNRVRHLRVPPVVHGKPVEVVTLARHGL